MCLLGNSNSGPLVDDREKKSTTSSWSHLVPVGLCVVVWPHLCRGRPPGAGGRRHFGARHCPGCPRSRWRAPAALLQQPGRHTVAGGHTPACCSAALCRRSCGTARKHRPTVSAALAEEALSHLTGLMCHIDLGACIIEPECA
jgi:hypothetical protein